MIELTPNQANAQNTSLATFYHDVGGLKKGNNSYNMNRITDMLDLSPTEVGSIFGISRQNAHKIVSLKEYTPRNAVVSRKLSQIVKCIVLITLILKIPDNSQDQREMQLKISQWFKVPNPSYDMMSPWEMIANGNGEKVIQSLQSIFDSSFA